MAVSVDPVVNGISRHYEHQADQYWLEVMHGLVPDFGGYGAQLFQILRERSLDDPSVGKFAEFWLSSHPAIRDRVIYAQTCDSWSEGRSAEFVIDAKRLAALPKSGLRTSCESPRVSLICNQVR